MRRTAYIPCVCGKRGWRTEREAERALGECQHRARRARIAGLTVLRQERRIYQCDWTDLYHLTSQKQSLAS